MHADSVQLTSIANVKVHFATGMRSSLHDALLRIQSCSFILMSTSLYAAFRHQNYTKLNIATD